ncbi:MAG: ytxH [Paenibacillaceae bacterium]|jgi:gas vesicle protein|nr:ytxH [Paenibacillaceae bacterium]
MNMESVKQKSGVWKGVLAGGIIGASAALLFAPKSGKDLRKKLGDDLTDLKERSGELASGAQEKVSQWSGALRETGRERLQQAKTAATEAMTTIKESAGDLKDSASKAVGSLTHDAKEAVEEIKTAVTPDPDKLAEADNSSLAQNEKEMDKLGKEMDQMKTESELKKEGYVSDPIQKP